MTAALLVRAAAFAGSGRTGFSRDHSKLAVKRPGGVQASFDFCSAKNTAAGRMLTTTPSNDLDRTVDACGLWHRRERLWRGLRHAI